MADFYIVTGGTASSKILIGYAYARKYQIPILFGESFYNDAQFRMACSGTPFDALESAQWAQATQEAMAATGGCVLVCRHISETELESWKSSGNILVIDTDPGVEEINARRTTEQNAPHITHAAGHPNFSRPETIEEEILSRERAIQQARETAEYDAMIFAYVQEHEKRLRERYGY